MVNVFVSARIFPKCFYDLHVFSVSYMILLHYRSRVNKMREEDEEEKDHIPMTTGFDHYYDHETVGAEVDSIRVSFTDIEDLMESKY